MEGQKAGIIGQHATQAQTSLQTQLSQTISWTSGQWYQLTLTYGPQGLNGCRWPESRLSPNDALDYTISAMTLLSGASVTVLPGTAIGFRHDWFLGFDLWEGSSFVSEGMPAKPITYVPVSSVQEGPFPSLLPEWLLPGYLISFLPDYWPNEADDAPPFMSFRFSNFYLNSGFSHHFLAGKPAGFLDGLDTGWTVCSAI